jgi:hypothetical protein
MVKELKDSDKLWKNVVGEWVARSEKCDDAYVSFSIRRMIVKEGK